MKKLVTSFVFLYCINLGTYAQNGIYTFAKIDTALLKNANAVVRLDDTRFEIVSTKQTLETDHYVITILNEKGEKWARFSDYYDKHRQINSIEGILYDAYGKELKKIKKKDTEDLSAVSGGTLMSDDRIKQHSFYYRNYPYTIEYTIEIENKASLFFPRWVPQGGEAISVESSTMSVVAPANYEFRYKMFNYKDKPVASEQKNGKMLTWSVKNVRPIIYEPYSPRFHEIATMVIFGPTQFQMDDYVGNMQSWQDFGKFIYTLNQGRDELSPAIKEKVHAIADALPDRKEKIARLYEFMQKNTRYISIQLGIGGFQPFTANEVASKGYGDCKALTNFMYSILKEAGIKSNYNLVRAGKYERYITEDFPSSQFNHAILSIPMQHDTMWLECTSQTLPAGYMSEFTCNRKALMIDENGGRLISTPVYSMKDNIEIRNIKAVLQDDGTLMVKAESKYGGIQQDDVHEIIHNYSKDKIKEYLHKQFDFATYDINTFDYKEENSSLPCIKESLDITVSNYATITGKRLFIVPNVMTRSTQKLSPDSTRKYPIDLNFEIKDIDSVYIEIPAGYKTEAMPQPVTIKSKFGNYNCNVKLLENKLFYYRSIEYNSGHFEAAYYDEFVKFYEAIYKADRNKVVLVKEL